MAQLAIRGHKTRRREVTNLLEMLGGRDRYGFCADISSQCFYINKFDDIDMFLYGLAEDSLFETFTLEEFEEKFPYKVGDKVLVKGYESPDDILEMTWNGSEIEYRINIEDEWLTADELQPYKEETMEEDLNYCKTSKITTVIFQEQNYEDKVELDLGDNYEIKVEDGKTYVVRKKPQYPKIYEECLEVLDLADFDVSITYVTEDERELFTNLIKLKRCRDAYWKIAGEQMGLGKPWEPDWKSSDLKYVIKTMGDEICESTECAINCFLAFPTEEMRDEYKNNFDAQIKFCKEYL